jgi:hypothetical protein
MGISATCPRCGRAVSMPTGATPSSQVRCPMCRSEFRLQEAFDFNPPVLEVIAGPVKQEATAAATATAAVERLAAVQSERAKPDQSIPELLINPEKESWEFSSQGANQKATVGRGSNRPTGVRRRQRNPVAELVKIVLGGFLGLAIGYGILLWGLKTDPFNLARYLPAAMVPESLAAPDAGKGGN